MSPSSAAPDTRRKASASSPDFASQMRETDSPSSTLLSPEASPSKKRKSSTGALAGEAAARAQTAKAAKEPVSSGIDLPLLLEKLAAVVELQLDPQQTAKVVSAICAAFSDAHVKFEGDRFLLSHADESRTEQLSITAHHMMLGGQGIEDALEGQGSSNLARFGLAADSKETTMALVTRYVDKMTVTGCRAPILCVVLAAIHLAQERIDAQKDKLSIGEGYCRQDWNLLLHQKEHVTVTWNLEEALTAVGFVDFTIHADRVQARAQPHYERAIRNRTDFGAHCLSSEVLKLIEVTTPDLMKKGEARAQGIRRAAAFLKKTKRRFIVIVLTDGFEYTFAFVKERQLQDGYQAYVTRPFLWENERALILGLLARLIESQVFSFSPPDGIFQLGENLIQDFFDYVACHSITDDGHCEAFSVSGPHRGRITVNWNGWRTGKGIERGAKARKERQKDSG